MKEDRNSISLDRYDHQILEILQSRGRISNQALAERINLSPAPCLRRVRALESAGFITGYKATVDEHKLGYDLHVVLLIAMDEHTPERFAEFESRISALPEVHECLLITGQEADYMLRLAVRDMEDYHRVLLSHITRIPGVSGVHSSFVLRRIFQNRGLPPAQD